MVGSPVPRQPFFGWKVVAAAFVLAIFGWGLGFYGPPIYLQTVHEIRGWPIAFAAAAVTLHYLCGALVVANLPILYRRFGVPRVTIAGALLLAAGLPGWANAVERWQLLLAAVLTGSGWVTMGAAAINAIIAPWFVRLRPKALSTAYNGASIGGIIFSPLWVFLIGWLGFATAALLVSANTVLTVVVLAHVFFGKSPADFGQAADGDGPAAQTVLTPNSNPVLTGSALWRDRKFRTLAAGMALGLFAQIGVLAHLFSLIIPALGPAIAGVTMGAATASAIAGRTAFGWLMPAGADRRIAAVASYAVQIGGIALLMLSGMQSPAFIIAGILLFGFGIGNATSLPPLVAQAEFAREDGPRVVALIVSIAQAVYAFAPALFGLSRAASAAGTFPYNESSTILAMAAAIKGCAIIAFLAGRKPRD